MIKLVKPESQMNNLKTIENKHQVCKSVALESIGKLLAEYIDPKYSTIQPTEKMDLDVESYFDYLILPLLAKNEVFILKRFASNYFKNDENRRNLNDLLSKTLVFEDLVELLVLVKRLHEGFELETEAFELRMLICVSYFRNMKDLKTLHSELHKINLAKFEAISYKEQKSINDNQKETIARYKLRIESKLNLLNCINIFQNKSTEVV